MTTADDVLRIASGELGYVEHPKGSNRTKYGQFYGLDGNAWCAMFVSWVFYQAGMPLPITTSKGFAWTPAGKAWFAKQGRWIEPNSKPQRGDVVFFDFPNDGVNRISHVGIVEIAHGVRDVTSIEGNTDEAGGRTGGKVMRRRRSVGIVGYGRPAYSATSPPSTPQPSDPNDLTERVMANNPLLTRGASGHHVKILQALLCVAAPDLVRRFMGFEQFIDGDFGITTESVLRSWQARTTLEADGVCGPKTWAWLIGI